MSSIWKWTKRKIRCEVFQHSYPKSVLQIFLVVTTTKSLLLLYLLFKENTSKIQKFRWNKCLNLFIFSLCFTLLNEFLNTAHSSCGNFSVVVLVLFVSSSFVHLLLKILVWLCNDDGFHRFATIKASSCAAARHSQQDFDHHACAGTAAFSTRWQLCPLLDMKETIWPVC